ncbi:MAG: zeta toxin family protein [Neisseriaceae bacterium]
MSLDFEIASLMLNKAKNDILEQGIEAVSKPTLIILGGQPGSGKSSGIKSIESEERFKGNIITLSADDFKLLYPNYDQLLLIDPIKTSYLVQPYANYVTNELKKEFANKQYNLIIEGTMRTVEVPLSTCSEFKNKGYITEAYIVASNYYASRSGCLTRLEKEIYLQGTGRSVPIESHDAAYKNIPITLEALMNSQKLDNITILSRQGEVLGNLKNGDNILSIYTDHRNKLSSSEHKQINEDLDNVLKIMQNRNAGIQEITQVNSLKRQFNTDYSYKINETNLEALKDNDKVFNKTHREQELDKYVYPDTNVLKNNFNVRDNTQLSKLEILAQAKAQIRGIPLGNFDYPHLKNIHKELFGDIYDWAGKTRIVDITKGYSTFCRNEYIEPEVNKLFNNLSEKDKLLTIYKDKKEFVQKFSYYFSEINAVHPFREGNGRTTRVFFEQLALHNNYKLDLLNVSKEQWIEASIAGFNFDNTKLENIFTNALQPINLSQKLEIGNQSNAKTIKFEDSTKQSFSQTQINYNNPASINNPDFTQPKIKNKQKIKV